MKYMNIIKLLTVLLCIGVLFIACDKVENDGTEEVTTEALETETETEVYTEEALLENVEAKFENFFEIVDASNNTLSGAEKIDGVIQSSYGDLVALKETDIDTKNNVTETFKVYNTKTGELVFTVSDEYFNCKHDAFGFNESDFVVVEDTKLTMNDDGSYSVDSQQSRTYRESYMVVVPSYVYDYYNYGSYINYFIVAHAEVTPISEEIREQNPDGCVYEIRAKYSYYDAYGTLITESNTQIEPYKVSLGSSDVAAVVFGTEMAYFNQETGALVSTSTAINNEISGLFKYENERYGYYTTMGTSLSVGTVSFMDIVNKQSGEVTRYHFDNEYPVPAVFYLHNGDVMIQYRVSVDESEPYDYYTYVDDSFTFYRAKTVILSVDDGVETVIEKPEFFATKLMTGEDFAENAYVGAGKELKVTANARNIARIYRIVDGVMSNVDEMVVLDNNLAILYTVERITDEQTFDLSGLGYTVLPNGDRLVTVNTGDIASAIVDSEGEIRANLSYNHSVIGDYVVDGTYLYDYDLNVICNYAEQNYRVMELFGKCIFVSNDDNRCMSFTVVDGMINLEELMNENQTLENSGEDYAIFYNGEKGRYVLYNRDMVALIVSPSISAIYQIDDGGYLVKATTGNEVVCYVLK